MAINIARRKFTVVLVSTAVAWSIAARAQQPGQMRRIGVLMNGVADSPEDPNYLPAFLQALRELGWSDGRNVHIDYRWNAGDAERARAYAVELVALTPDVILSATSANLAALQQATRTIPVVFTEVSDPMAQGFVSNLAHPGGNLTGFSAFEPSIAGKWLDLLQQFSPSIVRVAVIYNPDTSPQSKLFMRSIEEAAPSFAVEAIATQVHTTADIEAAMDRFSAQPNSGLIFPTDTFTMMHSDVIIALPKRYRLPAVYGVARHVRNGGLMFYGPSFADQFRQSAFYVDRILKGGKPGDLPVHEPTKFSLVINVAAAKALGVEVPLSLMMRADELIE
jgi:putative ABC transport system substrate-binding protein